MQSGLLKPLTAWRAAAWALGLYPAVMLAWAFTNAGLGANPVEFLEHNTGLWALRILLVCLAMTPLRRFTKRSEAIQVRRLLGLWAYFWVTVHFAIYLTFDLEWSLRELGADLIKRTYITLGFVAWLLLLPLAVTSTRGWQRRLKRRWGQLHKLIYPAALLGGVHFFWLVKSDVREPLLYIGIWAALMLLRIKPRAAAAKPKSATGL
ncbi:sulfite oxidase heme-binding subunit YedZ [Hydrocarboniphaga sp.]|uniref:sulfite oxidase heme-binding subunit YedZ n=1 Tax=Hydrocarboniphaga sp. TaxID=2033016 RepID=UPI003D102ED5